MICRTCFRRVASLAAWHPISHSLPIRSFSTSIPFRNAAAAAAATQPELTTPIQPAAATEDKPSRSICKAGTPLNGLNYIKGKTDPVALADEEYPEWLWNCLEVQKKASDAADDDAGDEFCKYLSIDTTSTIAAGHVLISGDLPQPNPRSSDD